MFFKTVLVTILFGTTLSLVENNFNSKDADISSQTNWGNAINKSIVYFEKISKEVMIPGIVVGVSFNGTQVWTHPFGFTDIENDVKTRVDSVWRLGSISKSLTSALVARLIDEKKIDLEKSIYEYLKPNIFPIKKWDNKSVTITVRQLMSHTAGLYQVKFPEDFYKRLTFANVTETIAPHKDEPLEFAPGTKWNYCNYGFQLIGAIIESVLNETYERAINKMFDELGMKSTFCERREQIYPHRARYYITTTSADKNKTISNVGILDDLVSYEAYWPAGGIVSTVPDLLKFGVYMSKWSKGINGSQKVNLSEKSVKTIWTPVSNLNRELKLNITNTLEYANGWFVLTLAKPLECSKCKISPIKQLVWHSGGIYGVHTYLMIEPQNEIVITIFNNHIVDTFHDSLNEIALNLFKNFIE